MKEKVMHFFTMQDIVTLTKLWIKENRWKEDPDPAIEAYNAGVADGADFVLFLMERWGE